MGSTSTRLRRHMCCSLWHVTTWAVACGAVVLGPEFGELKRMFVKPALRGRGLAGALLRVLEDSAASHGCTTLALETGYLQPEAIRLYERFGYAACGPFGEYQPDPNSVFMRKSLG
jgi:putative acetyltransferase